MDLSRLERGELIAALGGILLAVGIFLPWYRTAPDNANAADRRRGAASFSAWNVHPIMRWLLLAAAVAPLILAWIIVRDHELSWPRGEMTAVVGDRRLRADLLRRRHRPARRAARGDLARHRLVPRAAGQRS